MGWLKMRRNAQQVIAALKDSALAHLSSGRFSANTSWLACAAIAYNLSAGHARQ
jgi:hypothetical protein